MSVAAPGTIKFMVHENEADAVVVPSDTVTVVANTPVAVGVPEMTPVDALIDRPVGRPAALKVSGLHLDRSRSSPARLVFPERRFDCRDSSPRADGSCS